MSGFFLGPPSIVCALGGTTAAVRDALFAPRPSGVAVSTFFSEDRPLALGQVHAPLPSLAEGPAAFDSRNNALLARALDQLEGLSEALARHGPEGVGVVIGTSTSGIGEAERAHAALLRDGRWPDRYHYAQQELGAPARFVAARAGLRGPTAVISTACSSSARALATAARWLREGLVGAVVVGGADSLCRFTIAGFLGLEAVSAARCNPFSRNRNGINLGEAATLFVMTTEDGPVRLAGWGETNDAHHVSAPEPSGKAASEAMRLALARAQVGPREVEYVNLHGTGTPQNDAMEARAVVAALGHDAWASSTKPLTGHTLGAAGALEAALCWLTLTGEGHLPPHWYDGAVDESLPRLRLVPPGERLSRAPRVVLSNSFAFGGNNTALVMVRS